MSKRDAFTMIELIFVIVLLGILTAVAIPKLTATIDDAKITEELANFKTCMGDLQNTYTATGQLGITKDGMGVMITGPDACEKLKCILIDGYGSGANGSADNVIILKATAFAISDPKGKYCKPVYDIAFPKWKNNAYIPPIIHRFDGTRVIF